MSKTVKLSAKWQLDAALLSRPVDLTALVSMSRSNPEAFAEDNTLKRLVTALLNERNAKKSDKDTKLDVLNVLANVAYGSKKAVHVVRDALQEVNEWFDHYMAQEESTPGQEPELNKAMVLLLARCWDYKLKTEDVLELTQGNRKIALCTVVGLLEDGETYSTELKQRQKPGQGRMGQWEHELVCHRYEKPLLLQVCRLLRGFTHPGTYFESTEDIALYSVEKFSDEMDTLLEITLRSNLVEKLSMALFDCLFEQGGMGAGDDNGSSASNEYDAKSEAYGSLGEYDHVAVASVHAFLQNLYFYATKNTEEYRRHLLMETLLIPRLVLPYLDRCVIQASMLNSRAEAYQNVCDGDAAVAEMALHNPNFLKGMSSSLRTLIIASFRAPSTQFVMALMKRLNPTVQLLRARSFCRYHDYIFALICMLNVNMGSLDISHSHTDSQMAENIVGDSYAGILLNELASVFNAMSATKQAQVVQRLLYSGALPISRDTPSYAAMMSVLHGGSAGQLDRMTGSFRDLHDGSSYPMAEAEERDFADSRAEAKRLHYERMSQLRMNDERDRLTMMAESKNGAPTAFQIAVSVANASEQKDNKPSNKEDMKGGIEAPTSSSGNKFRLLGDLPELSAPGRGKGYSSAASSYAPSKGIAEDDEDIEVAVSLEIHSKNGKKRLLGKKAESKPDSPNLTGGDSSIPKEFLCAINGHVMKDPVRVKSTGLVFESATIDLWLVKNGAVCPITSAHLERRDLEPDHDLRNRIKRYQIQQMTTRVTAAPGDDLYDF